MTEILPYTGGIGAGCFILSFLYFGEKYLSWRRKKKNLKRRINDLYKACTS
jgi:hypothetical protein